MNVIYTITGFTRLEPSLYGVETGSSRVFGFYSSFETAKESVMKNSCDICETIYKYMLIEEIEEGLYSYCPKRWLFKWVQGEDRYESIEEPEFMNHFVNFSIG